jgi:hypothetical protein
LTATGSGFVGRGEVRDRKGAIVPHCDPNPPLDLYCREVEDMIDDGASLDDLEASIDATGLASDQRAALWLLAWSLHALNEERARPGPALRLVRTQRPFAFGGVGHE